MKPKYKLRTKSSESRGNAFGEGEGSITWLGCPGKSHSLSSSFQSISSVGRFQGGKISWRGASQPLLEGRSFTIPTSFPRKPFPPALGTSWASFGRVGLWAKGESLVPSGTRKLHNPHSFQGFQDLPQTYTTGLTSHTHQVLHTDYSPLAKQPTCFRLKSTGSGVWTTGLRTWSTPLLLSE